MSTLGIADLKMKRAVSRDRNLKKKKEWRQFEEENIRIGQGRSLRGNITKYHRVGKPVDRDFRSNWHAITSKMDALEGSRNPELRELV